MALGDPQAPAGDQEAVHVQAILGNPERLAPLRKLGRGLEVSTLDVHHHRHREELQQGEMRLVHEQQAGLGLDLSVVKRALREGDLGAPAVEEPLSRRVALTACALEREVEQSKRRVVVLAELQRLQRQERGVRGGAGR